MIGIMDNRTIPKPEYRCLECWLEWYSDLVPHECPKCGSEKVERANYKMWKGQKIR